MTPRLMTKTHGGEDHVKKEMRTRLEMYDRVDQFEEQNKAEFPDGSLAARSFAKLKHAAEVIRTVASSATEESRAGRAQKPPARADPPAAVPLPGHHLEQVRWRVGDDLSDDGACASSPTTGSVSRRS